MTRRSAVHALSLGVQVLKFASSDTMSVTESHIVAMELTRTLICAATRRV